MDSLVEYFLQNHDKFLYVLAGLSLVIELAMLGLSGPLLFFAIGCAITGLSVSGGIINSWEFEVLSVGVFSTLSAVLLWKPLKKLQGPDNVSDNTSDMIGQVVPVSEEITINGGSVRHSGINWQARLDHTAKVDLLPIDTRVEITAVNGNVMIVNELASKTL